MTKFDFVKLDLEGAYLIDNFYVGDGRGSFSKVVEKDIYSRAGIDFSLNETFLSVSAKNVLRGLHFQIHSPQAKLVSAPRGRVWDVIVDLRPDSKTFKQWRGFELSGENHRALYVPRGFAHGFVSLEDDTMMLYQCDGAYDKETDSGIRFDDSDLAVEWPVDLDNTIHSERDLHLMSFKEYMASPMEL